MGVGCLTFSGCLGCRVAEALEYCEQAEGDLVEAAESTVADFKLLASGLGPVS